MTSGVRSVARYQRYSSEILSKFFVALIAAAPAWRGSYPHPIWSRLAVRLPALPVVDGLSVVMRRPALLGIPAVGTEGDEFNGRN